MNAIQRLLFVATSATSIAACHESTSPQPATGSVVAGSQDVTEAARLVVQDAANRIASVLPEDETTAQLRSELQLVQTYLVRRDLAGLDGSVHRAKQLLAAFDGVDELAADVAAMQLALDAAALRESPR